MQRTYLAGCDRVDGCWAISILGVGSHVATAATLAEVPAAAAAAFNAASGRSATPSQFRPNVFGFDAEIDQWRRAKVLHETHKDDARAWLDAEEVVTRLRDAGIGCDDITAMLGVSSAAEERLMGIHR